MSSTTLMSAPDSHVACPWSVKSRVVGKTSTSASDGASSGDIREKHDDPCDNVDLASDDIRDKPDDPHGDVDVGVVVGFAGVDGLMLLGGARRQRFCDLAACIWKWALDTGIGRGGGGSSHMAGMGIVSVSAPWYYTQGPTQLVNQALA